MKTTLDIEDKLLTAAKQRALDTGTSLRHVVETALAQLLKPHTAPVSPIKTIVFTPALSSQSPPPTTDTLSKAAYPNIDAHYLRKRLGAERSS